VKVTLIGHTNDPLGTICTAIATMKAKHPLQYVLARVDIQKEDMVKEIMKTRLRGALEFASFEFLVEGVTRAFTHQLVRHRTFHFSQQSMRFFDASESGFRVPQVDSPLSKEINEMSIRIFDTYGDLIDHGCPIEDARSILPTNVLTSISFGATYRGLIDLAEVRMCLQTQAEFREFMDLLKSEIQSVSPFLGSLLMPVCKRTGRCEFKSIFDRPCPLRSAERRTDNGIRT